MRRVAKVKTPHVFGLQIRSLVLQSLSVVSSTGTLVTLGTSLLDSTLAADKQVRNYSNTM